MPSFANPFVGNVNRKMTDQELANAIRLDIAGELEAIYLYDAHAAATDNELAKKVLADIRDEEKQHMGELLTLLMHLDPTEKELFDHGAGEVREMMEELEKIGKKKKK
ncbi:MAG: demethoxyubiquinone hydroxylase family protein [Methanomassiliicoccaceae archaeon]|jgi:rubrerythrin|nr:demethoxyubiquinone hydroxylase family protein [Methanomassiliicoccaceae archaeon]